MTFPGGGGDTFLHAALYITAIIFAFSTKCPCICVDCVKKRLFPFGFLNVAIPPCSTSSPSFLLIHETSPPSSSPPRINPLSIRGGSRRGAGGRTNPLPPPLFFSDETNFHGILPAQLFIPVQSPCSQYLLTLHRHPSPFLDPTCNT